MFEGVLVEDEKVRERGKNKINNEAKDPTKCQLVSRCFQLLGYKLPPKVIKIKPSRMREEKGINIESSPGDKKQ